MPKRYRKPQHASTLHRQVFDWDERTKARAKENVIIYRGSALSALLSNTNVSTNAKG